MSAVYEVASGVVFDVVGDSFIGFACISPAIEGIGAYAAVFETSEEACAAVDLWDDELNAVIAVQ